jgi:hypothetical protein
MKGNTPMETILNNTDTVQQETILNKTDAVQQTEPRLLSQHELETVNGGVSYYTGFQGQIAHG